MQSTMELGQIKHTLADLRRRSRLARIEGLNMSGERRDFLLGFANTLDHAADTIQALVEEIEGSRDDV